MASIETVIASAFAGGLLTYIGNVIIKQKEYRDAYYKEIIKKRLEIYDALERQVAVLKNSADDGSSQMYHVIFSYEEDAFHQFQRNLIYAMSHSLWVSGTTHTVLIEMSRLFFNVSNEIENNSSLTDVGKKYYAQIATVRDKLEGRIASDMMTLHKVKQFLKGKKENRTEFIPYKELHN